MMYAIGVSTVATVGLITREICMSYKTGFLLVSFTLDECQSEQGSSNGHVELNYLKNLGTYVGYYLFSSFEKQGEMVACDAPCNISGVQLLIKLP